MLSVTGSRMQFWAVLWHIRELSEHPIALGAIGAARILPVIVFSLIGGAVADSWDRRRVMFVTQFSMTLMALTLGLLTFQDRIALWHIYVLTALQAVAVSFDLPARQAMTPNLVPDDILPNAFTLISIAFQTGAIVGPALTGLLIAYGDLSQVYFVNALSFAAIIAALILMGKVKQEADPSGARKTVSLQAIRDGLAFIIDRPVIFSSMLLDFFATFFSSANALMPIFARDILRVGEVGYGWLSAAQSIGATGAALVLSQVDNLRRQGPILLAAVVMFGLATIVFGASPSFTLSMLALIMIGASDSVSMVVRNTIRQIRTPDYLRGRMVSINQIFFMGGPQLGEIEAGVIAQFFGAPFAVISGGIGCILAVGWVARRWPQLRSYSHEEAIVTARGD